MKRTKKSETNIALSNSTKETFNKLKLQTKGIEALQNFADKELSNIQLFQKFVSEEIKPTQDFLNSVRVSLEPIEQLSTNLRNSAKVFTKIVEQEKLANDVLRQGATVSHSYQLGNFEFLRNDFLESTLKPIVTEIPTDYDLGEIDSIADKLDRIEKLLINLTSLLRQSVKPETSSLSDTNQKYIATKIVRTKPSERMLKVNGKTILFTKNAKMADLLEIIFELSLEYEGHIPDDVIISKMLEIDLEKDNIQPEILEEYRPILKSRLKNLNTKFEQKAQLSSAFTYSSNIVIVNFYVKED